MKMKIKTAAPVLLFTLSLLLPINSLADEIKIGAGAAPSEGVFKPIKDAFEKATGHKISLVSSGPKIALQDLEKGSLDAAAAGLTVDDWMKLMKKEGAEIKDPGQFKAETIGKDRIVILLHKDNPVKALSKDQLKSIFTGKISNWKDVGGKDAPILVVWGSLIPGTNSMIQKHIMDDEPLLKDILPATDAPDVRQNVSANPEAIGIGPAAILNNTVNSPATPEVARPINLLTKGAPSAKVQSLIDFIKGEGNKYIK
jgi:phosphate transport system substrate-binding protein